MTEINAIKNLLNQASGQIQKEFNKAKSEIEKLEEGGQKNAMNAFLNGVMSFDENIVNDTMKQAEDYAKKL